MEKLSADLTRFDFHVNRFLDSEDVQQMTAEEVGQYILLLCQAWKLHKDATLPNDERYLKRVARVEKVSPIVRKKFSIVTVEIDGVKEHRLRNKRLYDEWLKAMNRYKRFSEGGKNSAARRNLVASNLEAPSNHHAAIPYHTNPYHTNPYQSNPDQSISKDTLIELDKQATDAIIERARKLQESVQDEDE